MLNKKNKVYCNTSFRDTFYSEITIGISANAILLAFHIRMWLLRQRPRLTDLPIGLLALIHIVMLLITGFISIDSFVSQGRIWSDITCKSFVYLHRVMRGLSFCITSLLSVLQAVTLSPRSSCLAKLKHKSSRHFLCFLFFLWVFYTSFSSHLVISIAATSNMTSNNVMYVTKSCNLPPMSYFLRHAISTLLTIREVFVMGLMSLSSGYMVIFLCRHKKPTQHLHRTNLSPKASPEQRATWIILLLLTFFLATSTVDSIVFYTRIMLHDNPTLYCIQILVAYSYATVTPLVFIGSEKRITSILRSMCGRQQICNYLVVYKFLKIRG